MGVNQAQPLEAGGCRAEKIQAGNENAPGITNDDHDDGAASIYEQTDLAVQAGGQKGQLTRQLVGAYAFGRGAPPVEFLQ